MVRDFKESTQGSYAEVLDKNLYNISKVPELVASDLILKKLKET